MGGGEDEDLIGGVDDITGHRMQGRQGLDLIAEELNADGQLFVHGDDLDGVAPYSEGPAGESDVVARVLHGHETAQEFITVDPLAHGQRRHAVDVLLGRTQAVDARDRGDDDDITAGQQGVGGGVAQALDLIVDGRVLLDEGVRLRNVGLGLVVVVIGHEVLNRVIRQQLTELGGHLRSQSLVGLHDEGRALHLLDQPGGGGGLAGAGGPEQDDVLLPPIQRLGELANRGGLVAGRLVGADDLERLVGAAQIGDGTHAPRLRGGGPDGRMRSGVVTATVSPQTAH